MSSDLSEIDGVTDSMEEYFLLKKSVFIVTLSMIGIAFPIVWVTLSLNTAISYLFGSIFGVVYLRMLAKDVEKINVDQAKAPSGRLAIFIGVIVVAARVDQLSILPVFLGFLTYKVAIVGYLLFTSVVPIFGQKTSHSQ